MLLFLVPTQKMPRLLTTSASACRRLILKAELMGIDTDALEFQEAQVSFMTTDATECPATTALGIVLWTLCGSPFLHTHSGSLTITIVTANSVPNFRTVLMSEERIY